MDNDIMMQTPSSLQFISLRNTTHISSSWCHSTIKTGNMLTPNNDLQVPYSSLFLRMQIHALQSIRMHNKNNKHIFNLELGSVRIQVKCVRDEKYFAFQEGIYRNMIVALIFVNGKCQGNFGNKIINVGEWTNFTIAIDRHIQLQNGGTFQLQECFPVLQLGHIDKNAVLQCKIQKLTLSNKPSQQLHIPQSLYQIKQLHQGPLETIPTNPIPPLSSLPPYSSPEEKPDKLYLCHDMRGGYLQDINNDNPYPNTVNKYSEKQDVYEHTYRCLHIGQASIFNYFSHKLITIPPLHWRRVCRSSRTLCLGTFIVESDSPSEQQYMSPYCIDLLVYLCRLYRFDGYLINIEYKVNNFHNLTNWLKKLVNGLHEAVPGSKIIWYDSIINNGSLKYQNQLNNFNQMYYRHTDGIFLNYWWNQEKISNSAQFYLKGKTIYVGSDCFGRGTFAGGGYNTYKAVQAISKADQGRGYLAPALFAMGYTYQKNQRNNIPAWKIHENSLYRGISFASQSIPHNKWQYKRGQENGFMWSTEGDWVVTSFAPCQRKYQLSLQNVLKDVVDGPVLSVVFFTTVAGTGPNFKDPYVSFFLKQNVRLEFTLENTLINEVGTGPCLASEKENIIQLKMEIDKELILDEAKLTVIEQGQDAQYWGGNYGSRFKNDTLYFMCYNRKNDWISLYKPNFPLGHPIPSVSNHNLGQGKHFHLSGTPTHKNYDFLSDCDEMTGYTMNPPANISIHHEDAYFGGTCLAVKVPNKLKLGQYQVTGQGGLLMCRVVIKGVEDRDGVRLVGRIGGAGVVGQLEEVKEEGNQWVSFTFCIQEPISKPMSEQKSSSEKQKKQNKKLVLFLETNNIDTYLLGETAVYMPTSPFISPQITSLFVYLTPQHPPTKPILFSLCLTTASPCRLLVQVSSKQQRVAWVGQVHTDQYSNKQAILSNMHGHPYQPIVVKICARDQSMRWVTIKQFNLQDKQLLANGIVRIV